MARNTSLDAAAISLSGLCLAHCLILPVLVVSLPMLTRISEAEWLHWTFVALAVPVSLMAFHRAGSRATLATLTAIMGLLLLVMGAAGWPRPDLEIPLTVAGSLTLAAAHLLNWRRIARRHRAVAVA